MNPEAKSELERILSLDPADLSESEKAYLIARRSYLTEEQKVKFEISEPVKTSKEVPPSGEPISPARKKK